MILTVRCACGASLVVRTERANVLVTLLNAGWKLTDDPAYLGPSSMAATCPQCASRPTESPR